MPEDHNLLDINDSSKRTLESMWKSLEAEGIDTGTLRARMVETVRKTAIAMEPAISHEFRVQFGDKTEVKSKRAFQIFGFDLLFDSDLNVWLLEINANPSMNMS